MTRNVLLAGIVLAFVLAPTAGWAQGNGVLRGQLVNATLGGGSVEGIEVMLRTFRGTSEDQSRVTLSDADGSFIFDGLDTSPDIKYLIQATYHQVVYPQSMFSFQDNAAEHTLQVPVYETTTSYDGIQVERAHIFVSVSGSSASVSELYVFTNQTDRTYIGSETAEGIRAISRFLLPTASRDLVFDDGSLGGRFRAIEGGFTDLEPLWPGQTSVMFAYVVDCAAGECVLDRQITHPIGNVNALIADTGIAVESANLSFESKQQAQSQDYLNYAGHGLAPGDTLNLRVRLSSAEPSRAAAAPRGSSVSSLPWIILGSTLALLALVYPFWQQHIRATATQQGPEPSQKRDPSES